MRGFGILYNKDKVKKFQAGGVVTLEEVMEASKAVKQADRDRERLKLMQKKLIDFGFMTGEAGEEASGDMNEATLKAMEQVQEVQRKIGTTADGIIGAKTIKAAKDYDIDLKFIGGSLNASSVKE